MKRLIILMSFFAIGCEKETPKPVDPTCNCKLQTEMNAYGYWEETNQSPQQSSEKDCDKDGTIQHEWTAFSSVTMEWINYRRVYQCQ